ncbi:Fatty-acid-CoA ligase [Mortierella sp. GBA30]|nr:Fatty-acid-CoA ligase [Mortierella sp. GBA30]
MTIINTVKTVEYTQAEPSEYSQRTLGVDSGFKIEAAHILLELLLERMRQDCGKVCKNHPELFEHMTHGPRHTYEEFYKVQNRFCGLKLGFELESLHWKQMIHADATWRHTYFYAMTDDDWFEREETIDAQPGLDVLAAFQEYEATVDGAEPSKSREKNLEDLIEKWKKEGKLLPQTSKRPWLGLGQKRFYALAQAEANHKPSYVRGSTVGTQLCEDPIGTYWDRIIDRHGDRLGLVVKHEQDLHWSFRQFGEQVDSLCRGLYESGLRKGDRLAVWMPNNSAWATLQYATAKSGIILVTLNPAYRRQELLQTLSLVECKSLVFVPGLKSSNYSEMLLELLPELEYQSPNQLLTEKLPSLRQVILFDNGANVPQTARMKALTRYQDLLVRNPSPALDELLQQERLVISNRDIINLQFTSGTTGLPKGVSLSHRNILNNAIHIGDNMRLTEEDRLCCPVPLFHCFGLVLASLAAMTHGSAIIYPSQSFDAEATLKAVSEERATALHGVPTMLLEELNHPNFAKYDLSSLRTGIAAGSLVPVEVMKNVQSKMHLKELTICYGMTETSPVSFMSLTTDALRDRCETVGQIMPHMEAKVIDPETGEVLPINSSGELCTRGYAVMEGGYWRSKKQTDEVVDKDGWMHTGDTAVLDDRGFCRIDGRIKDMVSRGGEKIYPVEVENCLFEMDAVQNVSVIGVPDKRYGEQVCAWISTKDGKTVTLEEVKKFCEGKIAHYKVPRYLVVVEPNEFPTTPSGKIQKNVMREISKTKLQLS